MAAFVSSWRSLCSTCSWEKSREKHFRHRQTGFLNWNQNHFQFRVHTAGGVLQPLPSQFLSPSFSPLYLGTWDAFPRVNEKARDGWLADRLCICVFVFMYFYLCICIWESARWLVGWQIDCGAEPPPSFGPSIVHIGPSIVHGQFLLSLFRPTIFPCRIVQAWK